MKRLYARHRLDIEPRHIAAGLAAMTAAGPQPLAAELERTWSPDGRGLAAYSVRSGFHLLLSALGLPAGSEVLFSAVTHPDMPRLAAHHGLVPVPVDLDRDTLAPRPDSLWRAVTPRTRMLVVAHLFGGLVDLDFAADLCDRHGLLLVEDCAQAFRGPQHTGSPLGTCRCSASACSRPPQRWAARWSPCGRNRCSRGCARCTGGGPCSTAART